MGKQKFTSLTKTLGVLLLVSFIMFVTDASASAVAEQGGRNSTPSALHSILVPASIHIGKENNNAGYGSRDYKVGSQAGAQNGYKEGYNAGLEDCFKNGRQRVLKKVNSPKINDKWTGNYKKGYSDSFNKGYLKGYSDARFKCLKK